MPKYLLSVFGPAERTAYGNYASREEMLQSFADTGVFNDRLVRDGYFVYADGLEPADEATVVDGQGPSPVTTEGPFLATKAQLSGFWIVDTPDLEVAIALAAEGSKACRGVVEVRPFHTAESIQRLLQP